MIGRFRWEAADSSVHRGVGDEELTPMVPSLVERFVVSEVVGGKLLQLDQLQIRATTGQRIQVESTMALFNAQ